MFYMEEFELFVDDGVYVAIPFDFEGGTQGSTLREASEMAWDWLKTELEQRLLCGETIPEPTVGNTPSCDNSRIVLIALNVTLDGIETVSAAKASELLGVTRGRVSQLFRDGKLAGYKNGRDLLITVDSIRARMMEEPRKQSIGA